MGWFDEMARRSRQRAQREAGRYVARKARDGARKALDAVTQTLFGRSAPEPDSPPTPEEEEQRLREQEERERRRRAREEREHRAREETERLKREAWAQHERMQPREGRPDPGGPTAPSEEDDPSEPGSEG